MTQIPSPALNQSYQSTLLEDSNRERFEIFHNGNPDIYKALIRRARQLKARGYKGVSIRLVLEVVRFDFMVFSTDQEYKINNNHAPFYARLIMQQEKDLKGFFTLRKQRAVQ